MKCIQAEFEKETQSISVKKEATAENWVAVCRSFNDDVERIRNVDDIDDYTALYECFDDQNKRFYYLVKEDKALYKMRRKRFLNNIGMK